jgi:ankyrin repeat protein
MENPSTIPSSNQEYNESEFTKLISQKSSNTSEYETEFKSENAEISKNNLQSTNPNTNLNNPRTPKKKTDQILYDDAEEFDNEQHLQGVRDKWNPMIIEGAKNCDVDRIKLALINGAQINHKDRQNWDPICWASCKGNLKIVEVLIEKGAIDVPNCKYLSTYSKAKEFIPQIIRGSLVENTEVNPLQLATIRGHYKIVALLMKNSFNSEIIDKFGNSIYHLAAASNNFETFQIFLQLGINLEKFNCRGHTPKDITTNQMIRDIIDLWKKTSECKITKRKFQKGDFKFWCSVCKEFFHKKGCQISWQNYELDSIYSYKPECLCVDCAKWRDKKVEDLRKEVENKDFDNLAKLTKLIEEEKVPLSVETKQWLEYQNLKLKAQKEILAKLKELEHISDYKTIKKAVYELEGTIPDNIILDQDVLEQVADQIKRLNSERNLRFFLDEYENKLNNPEEDPIQRVAKLKEERKKKAANGKKKRKRRAKSKKKETKRKDKKKKDKENIEKKPENPQDLLKNLKFDITIEDIENEENQPEPVNISDLQPLISQLDMYLTVAEANSVASEYIENAKHLKLKFQKRIRLEEIIELFESHPTRDYPPDPVWDYRGKRWLDGTTMKPLDPKKPVILPLNPPKKGRKGKRKKQEIEFPEWATDRKDLVKYIQDLEGLLEDEDVTLGQSNRLEQIQKSISRMIKENKFRIRIEKDKRLIEEYHAKSRKGRDKNKF